MALRYEPRHNALMPNRRLENIMKNTLYKRTHLKALVLFAALLASAGSAVALIGDRPARSVEPTRSEVVTVGRFVVTPHDAWFVPGRDTPVAK